MLYNITNVCIMFVIVGDITFSAHPFLRRDFVLDAVIPEQKWDKRNNV